MSLIILYFTLQFMSRFDEICITITEYNERINKIYNARYSADTIIVIIVFCEKLAQPARTVDYPLAFCFNIHSNTQSAKTFLAGFGKRGENASFSAKKIRFRGGSQGNGSISQRISDERRKRYFARGIFLRECFRKDFATSRVKLHTL